MTKRPSYGIIEKKNVLEDTMAIIMDGKALAVNMQEQLQEKVARLKEKEWIVPGLVVIMVGENPASQVYVRNKERAAKKSWLP